MKQLEISFTDDTRRTCRTEIPGLFEIREPLTHSKTLVGKETELRFVTLHGTCCRKWDESDLLSANLGHFDMQ